MTRLSDNAYKVLERRCLKKDARGVAVETPGEMFRRVAFTVAAAEKKWGGDEEVRRWEMIFYETLSQLLFLPNSPTLMNAGTGAHQLSACFVLPVNDTIDGIFSTLKNAALIQQSGGGTGFNFSHLRPRNDIAVRTAGIAAGPVAFMKVFNAATEQIKQCGIRRGANMGILDADHPDIEAFIFSKRTPGALDNFNISVGASDAFMQAVEKDLPWNLVHPRTGLAVRTVKAKDIWDHIIESAWRNGDPGIVFTDTINKANPTPALGKIDATNPCGEVPLLPYEPCNLGSVNLLRMVHKGAEGKREIDWDKLGTVVQTAIRFLDDVIEVNDYFIPEIKAMALGNRKIGLGVMGWAELLIRLEIPYESTEAIALASRLMQFIRDKSAEASRQLALQRGNFPNWGQSVYAPHSPMRNATRTSIAPTGTISIIADTSSSIEPLFALAFYREHVLNDERLFSVNHLFLDYLRQHQLDAENVIEQVLEKGVAGSVHELPDSVKQLFRTALEIPATWHLRHQLAFQQFTDNAVSKTINLPESAQREEVAGIYMNAWKNGAKGITIYRNHSKSSQVIWTGIKSDARSCKVCLV